MNTDLDNQYGPVSRAAGAHCREMRSVIPHLNIEIQEVVHNDLINPMTAFTSPSLKFNSIPCWMNSNLSPSITSRPKRLNLQQAYAVCIAYHPPMYGAAALSVSFAWVEFGATECTQDRAPGIDVNHA